MARFLTILGALLLASCASMGGEKQISESWMGAHVDDVVRAWGIPTNKLTLSDGSTVYEWDESMHYSMPAMTSGTVQRIGPNTAAVHTTTSPSEMHGRCIRSFTADEAGVIRRWSARGNNCCVMAVAGHCKSMMRSGNGAAAQP